MERAHKVFSQHLKDIEANEVGEGDPHFKSINVLSFFKYYELNMLT